MRHGKHAPAFQWKGNLIYDGDVVVARFRHDPDAKQHLALCDVRLTPGGAPRVDRWDLSWHSGCATAKLESLEARNVGEGLRLAFAATTPDQAYTSDTQIDLSFDRQRQCYRFETASSLQVNTFPFYSWQEIDSAKFSARQAFFPYEFTNILSDSYAYWAPVDPLPKKWQAFVYQNTEGGWSRVPQHHLLTPDKYSIHLPAGMCRLGYVDDPGGNPCIELMERVPAASRCGLCWAMNDIHLYINTTPLQERYRVRYALYQFTAQETAEILKQAKGYVYTDEERALYDRPRFHHDGKSNFSCDFETGYDLDQPDDNFRFWMCAGDIRYAAWVRGEGRGGGRCLKQDTPRQARVLWQVESTNAPVVQAGKRYRVTAWIRTQALKGAAYLEAWDVDCNFPQNPPSSAPGRSEALSDTADWREVAVDVNVVRGAHLSDEVRGKLFVGKVAIRLVHEGQGTSWFDDVSIREVGNASE